MKVVFESQQERAEIFARCQERADESDFCEIKYLDLGVAVIRVVCKTPAIIPHLQRQMTFVLRENSARYDATIVIWKESVLESFAKTLGPKFDSRRNFRLRLSMLYSKSHCPSVEMYEPHAASAFGFVNGSSRVVEAYDADAKTVYYGVENFEPEEFIKLGHVLVQQLNYILKDSTANIAHGAVIGYENNGILFCARGQRGKSTLTVHAMMHGFDYVSDDYQILDHRDGDVFASPIYSIITLSPTMYSELYDELKGKFVSNNARKDKYVINIADYHEQFRVNYPIRLCILPEITAKKATEIYPCSAAEKGRAIVQLIQSTVSQMRDMNDARIIRKMLNMVLALPFYKVDLCRDIAANTENLRKFLAKYDFKNPVVVEPPEIMVDITFNLANIIDRKTATIYSMNSFATNVYENLLMGRRVEEVKADVLRVLNKDAKAEESFDLFVKTIEEKGFLSAPRGVGESATTIDSNFIAECRGKMMLTEYAADETKIVI